MEARQTAALPAEPAFAEAQRAPLDAQSMQLGQHGLGLRQRARLQQRYGVGNVGDGASSAGSNGQPGNGSIAQGSLQAPLPMDADRDASCEGCTKDMDQKARFLGLPCLAKCVPFVCMCASFDTATCKPEKRATENPFTRLRILHTLALFGVHDALVLLFPAAV